VSVIRSFGVQTIASSNVSQPLFGTTLGANGSLAPDQFTGNTKPGSNEALSYIPVSSSKGFRVGDRVAIAPKGNFAYPYSSIDGGIIKTITTHSPFDIIIVQGLQNNHVSGEYFVLNQPFANLVIDRQTSLGNIYIGNGSDVSPTSAALFGIIQSTATEPFRRFSGSQFNPYQTIEFWIYGTGTDTFIASWDEF